jgi:FMN phosphatase YigB (HAD superfamily)
MNPDLNKVILTDCDGVLLNWDHGFHAWMQSKGYKLNKEMALIEYDVGPRFGIEAEETKRLCKEFNTHARIGYLPPLRDAVKYVRKLHEEEGYVFHCITAQTLDPFAQKLRIRNLEDVFGQGIFERYVFTDTGADKYKVLLEYQNSGLLWLEDKIENAQLGIDLGLASALIHHGYNASAPATIPRYFKWKEIYDAMRTY